MACVSQQCDNVMTMRFPENYYSYEHALHASHCRAKPICVNIFCNSVTEEKLNIKEKKIML